MKLIGCLVIVGVILSSCSSNVGNQHPNIVPYQVFTSPGPIGLADLGQLVALNMPELKDPPFQPAIGSVLAGEESMFSVMSRRDVLLYHPYDSFSPVVDFVLEAAQDPDVLAIKQTLYRVGPNSPVVEALMEAELALGRHDDLIGELELLVAAHPLRERLWGQLMLALYRSGRQADALAAYQRAQGRPIRHHQRAEFAAPLTRNHDIARQPLQIVGQRCPQLPDHHPGTRRQLEVFRQPPIKNEHRGRVTRHRETERVTEPIKPFFIKRVGGQLVIAPVPRRHRRTLHPAFQLVPRRYQLQRVHPGHQR